MKRVVPFLKVDKGLLAEKDGVQLMKPIPGLGALLDKARTKRIFGTEGDHRGPTLSLRGLDNPTYYILEEDRSRYANYGQVACTQEGLADP